MKKPLLFGLLLLTTIAFAQKKELKKAEKALNAKNYTEALTFINQAESLIATADNQIKSQFYTLKGEANAGSANSNYDKLKNALEAFQKAESFGPTGKNANRLTTAKNALFRTIFNSAVADQKKDNFALAADKLYMAYRLNKTDTINLFYAAGSALNANKLDLAATYYSDLIDLNYTGVSKVYTAISKVNGEKQVYNNRSLRDKDLRLGTHEKGAEEITPSKVDEIYKNISYCYTKLGQKEKAIETFKKARERNPKDVSLIISEANLYYENGDNDKFKKLMEEATLLDPNNPDLFYNIGVVQLNNENYASAEASFKKALELNPAYVNAALNLSIVYTNKGNDLVGQMNALLDQGNAKAFKKFDELKLQKEGYFKEGAKFLENFRAANPGEEKIEILNRLKNIYAALDDQNNLNLIKQLINKFN